MLRRLLGRRMAPAPPPPPQPQAPAPPPRQPQAPAPAPAAPAPVAVPGVEAAVLAAAADGIVATDPAGQIMLANRAAQSQTGFGERELVGNSLHGLLHPACEDPHCPVIATQRDGRPRTFVTETMRRRDGSQVAAEVALSAMRDGGLVATLHDLADRRSEEDALRATAAGYRDLVEGVEDWIWTADRSGIVTFSNRAGEAVIGHRPARLIGHPLLDVVSPDARDEEARRLQDAAAAKQGWSVTVRRLHADGTERTLDSRASPILDAAGELLGWRGIERPAATAAPAPAPLQAAAPEPGPAEPAAPEAAPEGPAPREPGPWVRPAAAPAADKAAPIAPAPPKPGPSVPAAADPAAEELAPVEPAHVEPVPREAATVDVVSEAAPVDVVSEAAPVDVVSEAAPVEAVTEEAAAADAATEEAAPLEPPAAHEQAPAGPAAAGAPSDVSDPAAWETARAYLARAGVDAPAEPEPELGPPLTAPAVRQPTPGGGDVAIVRQPIANAEGAVVGYELLVGGGALGPRPLGEAGTTAAMLLDIFGDVGLDRLSGRHPAWVTITPAFLLEVGTPPVRPDRVVLQIAATPVPAEALAALQRLRWSGYTVALTGYDGRAELVELLDVAGIVKVTVAGRSDQELRTATAEPSKRNLKLIATRVETPEEVARCAALGFSLFQGVFFAKPNLVRQRRVGTGGARSLRTLASVAAPDASFEDLEKAISADVGLSLKLLRYVNSAFFSLPRTVGSVHEALTLLGMATVRRWAKVMALVEATSDAPEELVELALQRARMCEVLGGSPEPDHADALFTVGLFSVADALLDVPMEEVLETLPFGDEIRAALLRHEGAKGELLERVVSYERGEFPEGRRGELTLADAYADAVSWAGEARRAAPP